MTDPLYYPYESRFSKVAMGTTGGCGILINDRDYRQPVDCFSAPGDLSDSGLMFGVNYVGIDVLADNACVISDEGRVFCWGDDDDIEARSPIFPQ